MSTTDRLEASRREFEQKIERLRAERPAKAVHIRDDINVPGFCKHGIPANSKGVLHCPHGCKAVK